MENMEINKFYKNKRVLVTGHTGFKGSWLCQILLNFEAKVCGVALKPKTKDSLFSLLKLDNKMENHYLDIRNYNKLKDIFDAFKPEIVIHLAAQPIVLESYKNPKYTYDVNVMGTVNVCECIRKTDSVISFVNVTTDKVYENIEDCNHYYKENEKLNGYDPYSNSKSCSELVTQSYINSYFNMLNISVSTCRAGNVIGGGDFSKNRIIPDCVRSAFNEEAIIIRNPNSVRPYQHVLEADMFYLTVAMKQYINKKYSGNYNIGPNKRDCVDTKTLVKMFSDSWDRIDFQCKNVSGPHEANYLKLDTTKAKRTFNWKPVLNIKEAVGFTVAWFKAYKENKDVVFLTNKQIKEYLCKM